MARPRVLAAAGAFMIGCGVLTVPSGTPAPTSTPAPSQSVPGDIGFGRFVDSRDFTISFRSFGERGQDLAASMAEKIPDYWSRATRGRSRVRVVEGEADIVVLVVIADGQPSTGGGRLITMRLPDLAISDREMGVLLHELGHSLGCCYGQGANPGGHWTTCSSDGELMCASGIRGLRFSERELRVLRLD